MGSKTTGASRGRDLYVALTRTTRRLTVACEGELCPCCGWINRALTLDDREWDCQRCGEHHDRDIAAALNTLAEGIRIQEANTVAAGLADTQNDCGGSTRPARARPAGRPPKPGPRKRRRQKQ